MPAKTRPFNPKISSFLQPFKKGRELPHNRQIGSVIRIRASRITIRTVRSPVPPNVITIRSKNIVRTRKYKHQPHQAQKAFKKYFP